MAPWLAPGGHCQFGHQKLLTTELPKAVLRTTPRNHLVIYRESRPDEPGDWLVVSLMTPEEFGQQKQDEMSLAIRNPDVRREIAIAAGTAATTASTERG